MNMTGGSWDLILSPWNDLGIKSKLGLQSSKWMYVPHIFIYPRDTLKNLLILICISDLLSLTF